MTEEPLNLPDIELDDEQNVVLDRLCRQDVHTTDPALLAGLSRELSANDYRMRERPLRGLTLDSSAAVRNVTWRSPDPLSR